MIAYGDYAFVFAVAVVTSFLLTFPVRRAARHIGAVVAPGEARVHDRPTPTTGGAAMLAAFAAAMLVAWRLPGLQAIFAGSSEPLGLLLAAVVIFGVGLVDDVRNISAPAKVAGQVLAAMILVFLGVTMYWFKIPFVSGIIALTPSILPLITAVWVVGMANAVNLIDGLDGLAAGIIAIASAALCVYGIQLIRLGDLTTVTGGLGVLAATIACGACVGFLPHNFHPARVFMGDSGALFLGLLMAAATMIIGGRTTNAAGGPGQVGQHDVSGLTFFRFAPLFIPFFILGVPILDTAFAIVRRTVRRTGVAERDLGHLHHRLVRLGHGHRRAVLILWAWTALLSAFALVPIFDARANVIVPFAIAFLSVGLYTVFRPGSRAARGERLAVDDAERAGPVERGSGSGGGPGREVVSPGAAGRAPTAITVVVSGAAGVAVAGEPDLASPRTRRRGRRGLHRRSRRAGRPGSDPAPRARGAVQDVRFAEGDGEVGR